LQHLREANKIKPINARNATHSGAASDSNSPKVHRRDICLATVHTKLVSLPRHAEGLCLMYPSASHFESVVPF
jgi:hypothetical protein